jgi:hypothetical protein
VSAPVGGGRGQGQDGTGTVSLVLWDSLGHNETGELLALFAMTLLLSLHVRKKMLGWAG